MKKRRLGIEIRAWGQHGLVAHMETDAECVSWHGQRRHSLRNEHRGNDMRNGVSNLGVVALWNRDDTAFTMGRILISQTFFDMLDLFGDLPVMLVRQKCCIRTGYE